MKNAERMSWSYQPKVGFFESLRGVTKPLQSVAIRPATARINKATHLPQPVYHFEGGGKNFTVEVRTKAQRAALAAAINHCHAGHPQTLTQLLRSQDFKVYRPVRGNILRPDYVLVEEPLDRRDLVDAFLAQVQALNGQKGLKRERSGESETTRRDI